MRLAMIGVLLLLAGSIAAATGALPATELIALADRVVPILVFVAAITVVTELASEAGVFLWAGRRLRSWGLGSGFILWLLLALLATVSTIFLSLDTTAVLLTPAVVTVVRQAGLPPLPFVLTTVWLANTTSLLLPVSNLTNLLAQHTLDGLSPAGFAALMWAPAVAGLLVPMAVIGLIFRRDLRLRYARTPAPQGPRQREDSGPHGSSPHHNPPDRVLLAASGIVLVLLLPLLVSGLPVWIPATAAAVVLTAVFAVRRRRTLTFRLIPWPLLLFASGLFLAMEAFLALGGPVCWASWPDRARTFPSSFGWPPPGLPGPTR